MDDMDTQPVDLHGDIPVLDPECLYLGKQKIHWPLIRKNFALEHCDNTKSYRTIRTTIFG